MKVVITGGMGFIGARLGRALCDQAYLTDASGQDTPIDELLKDIGGKAGIAAFDLVQKIKDINAKIEEYLPDWMTSICSARF